MSLTRRSVFGVFSGILLASAVAAAAEPATVLDGGGTFWRWRVVGRPAVLVGQTQDGQRTTLQGQSIEPRLAEALDEPIADGWRAAAFDDADWPRATGRELEYATFILTSMDMQPGRVAAYCRKALLCLRGKFAVADPQTAGPLTLSLTYRGGALVYLNGVEVARGHMPAGEIGPATAAEPYADEAWLDAAGKLLPELAAAAEDKELAGRFAARDRTLGPIELPAKLLRAGVNVLAVEIHRADLHAAARQWMRGYTRAGWTPMAFRELRLTAAGDGVTPNCRRPAGVQVWNQDRNDRLAPWDYGDPNEPLRPLVLTAARNAVFSGKVVVSSDAAIDGLAATVGPLAADGGAALPASAVELLYSGPPAGEWVEALCPAAPAKIDADRGGAAQCVWVRLRVPADAKGGTYRGTLSISAGGRKLADVPVQAEVAGWLAPSPKDFRQFVGIYQSPSALAIRYGVEEWSERHWALMAKSFGLLGELGNRLVHVPLVERTKMGNDRGMLTWVRRPGGGFDYDFTVIERYLKMVRQAMPTTKFVVAHVWHAGGWTPAEGVAKQKNTVTVLDPATGKVESMQVPVFGTAESKAFWTPVLTGLGKRLADVGLADALCLGSLCEPLPPPDVAKMFADILGSDPGWCRMTHAGHGSIRQERQEIPGGGHVALHVFTYLPGLAGRGAPLPEVWHDYWPRVAYYRFAQGTALPLVGHRMIPIQSRLLGLPGFSHVCLDYWLAPTVSGHRGGLLYGYWPGAGNYPGDPEPPYLVWPGPDGAEPLTAFEAVREGLQEAEAMIVVGEALGTRADSLPPGLAGRCRGVIRDMLDYCRERNLMHYQRVFYHMNHYGWRDISRRLFECAAAVAG